MNKTSFLSKEVSLKRIGVALIFTFLCPIMLYVIGAYYSDLINTSLKNHYTNELSNESQASTISEPIVLGTADISLLTSEYDKEYAKGANIYTSEEWTPEQYIEMQRSIDNPQYDVKAGSTTKDKWLIGKDDYLYLECDPINAEYLSYPPYFASCTLKINDYTIQTNLRSDVTCDWDKDYKNPTNCKQEVYLVKYTDEHLKNQYLFYSSLDTVGSVYSIWAYELGENGYTPLYFDFIDSISQYKLTRGGLYTDNLYLAFTDNSKTDFRLITSFYDPAMQSIYRIDYEWQVTNRRLLLKNKVVEM